MAIDELVLARAKKGDMAAMETIYRTFEKPVYTLALRVTRSQPDAEDVLQETFIEAFKSLKKFRGDGEFSAWLRKIAATKSLMKIRSLKVRSREEQMPEGADFEAPVRLPVAGGHLSNGVESALGELSAEVRAVVWLHDVEGYTHEEIAELFGRTPSFSKSCLSRAHAKLRELLLPDGGRELCMQP